MRRLSRLAGYVSTVQSDAVTLTCPCTVLQGDEETRRRGAVLMRLIGAGDQLDTLLGLHAEDIDEQLLEMLYSRIQLAVRQA